LGKKTGGFHQVKQDAENIFVGDSSFKSIEKQENVFAEKDTGKYNGK
jgi:hypothetical protein